MQKSRLKDRASDRYNDDAVVDEVVRLGERIGAFAAEDELGDEHDIEGLAEVILSAAPHQALVKAFRTIAKQPDATIDELINLFGKTRVAEMASYAQVAAERVLSIRNLIATIDREDVSEADLQQLIANAPWLIRPDWSILTQNQALKTFRNRFVDFFKRRYDQEIDVAISYEHKRPDFTLIQHGSSLRIVEIKSPGHVFDDNDYVRLQNYVAAFRQFFEENKGATTDKFSEGWHIYLIADGVHLKEQSHQFAYESFEKDKTVVRQSWEDFLAAAVQAHEEILDIYDQAHADD